MKKACREHPTTGVHKCYNLEPELTDLMAQTGDYDAHLWAWKTWHEGIKKMNSEIRTLDLFNWANWMYEKVWAVNYVRCTCATWN